MLRRCSLGARYPFIVMSLYRGMFRASLGRQSTDMESSFRSSYTTFRFLDHGGPSMLLLAFLSDSIRVATISDPSFIGNIPVLALSHIYTRLSPNTAAYRGYIDYISLTIHEKPQSAVIFGKQESLFTERVSSIHHGYQRPRQYTPSTSLLPHLHRFSPPSPHCSLQKTTQFER